MVSHRHSKGQCLPPVLFQKAAFVLLFMYCGERFSAAISCHAILHRGSAKDPFPHGSLFFLLSFSLIGYGDGLPCAQGDVHFDPYVEGSKFMSFVRTTYSR